MTETLANLIVSGLKLYALLGLCVGLAYLFGGAGKIDKAAVGKGMPLQARLLVFPGVVGLWPLMLKKLLMQKDPPVS